MSWDQLQTHLSDGTIVTGSPAAVPGGFSKLVKALQDTGNVPPPPGTRSPPQSPAGPGQGGVDGALSQALSQEGTAPPMVNDGTISEDTASSGGPAQPSPNNNPNTNNPNNPNNPNTSSSAHPEDSKHEMTAEGEDRRIDPGVPLPSGAPGLSVKQWVRELRPIVVPRPGDLDEADKLREMLIRSQANCLDVIQAMKRMEGKHQAQVQWQSHTIVACHKKLREANLRRLFHQAVKTNMKMKLRLFIVRLYVRTHRTKKEMAFLRCKLARMVRLLEAVLSKSFTQMQPWQTQTANPTTLPGMAGGVNRSRLPEWLMQFSGGDGAEDVSSWSQSPDNPRAAQLRVVLTEDHHRLPIRAVSQDSETLSQHGSLLDSPAHSLSRLRPGHTLQRLGLEAVPDGPHDGPLDTHSEPADSPPQDTWDYGVRGRYEVDAERARGLRASPSAAGAQTGPGPADGGSQWPAAPEFAPGMLSPPALNSSMLGEDSDASILTLGGATPRVDTSVSQPPPPPPSPPAVHIPGSGGDPARNVEDAGMQASPALRGVLADLQEIEGVKQPAVQVFERSHHQVTSMLQSSLRDAEALSPRSRPRAVSPRTVPWVPSSPTSGPGKTLTFDYSGEMKTRSPASGRTGRSDAHPVRRKPPTPTHRVKKKRTRSRKKRTAVSGGSESKLPASADRARRGPASRPSTGQRARQQYRDSMSRSGGHGHHRRKTSLNDLVVSGAESPLNPLSLEMRESIRTCLTNDPLLARWGGLSMQDQAVEKARGAEHKTKSDANDTDQAAVCHAQAVAAVDRALRLGRDELGPSTTYLSTYQPVDGAAGRSSAEPVGNRRPSAAVGTSDGATSLFPLRPLVEPSSPSQQNAMLLEQTESGAWLRSSDQLWGSSLSLTTMTSRHILDDLHWGMDVCLSQVRNLARTMQTYMRFKERVQEVESKADTPAGAPAAGSVSGVDPSAVYALPSLRHFHWIFGRLAVDDSQLYSGKERTRKPVLSLEGLGEQEMVRMAREAGNPYATVMRIGSGECKQEEDSPVVALHLPAAGADGTGQTLIPAHPLPWTATDETGLTARLLILKRILAARNFPLNVFRDMCNWELQRTHPQPAVPEVPSQSPPSDVLCSKCKCRAQSPQEDDRTAITTGYGDYNPRPPTDSVLVSVGESIEGSGTASPLQPVIASGSPLPDHVSVVSDTSTHTPATINTNTLGVATTSVGSATPPKGGLMGPLTVDVEVRSLAGSVITEPLPSALLSCTEAPPASAASAMPVQTLVIGHENCGDANNPHSVLCTPKSFLGGPSGANAFPQMQGRMMSNHAPAKSSRAPRHDTVYPHADSPDQPLTPVDGSGSDGAMEATATISPVYPVLSPGDSSPRTTDGGAQPDPSSQPPEDGTEDGTTQTSPVEPAAAAAATTGVGGDLSAGESMPPGKSGDDHAAQDTRSTTTLSADNTGLSPEEPAGQSQENAAGAPDTRSAWQDPADADGSFTEVDAGEPSPDIPQSGKVPHSGTGPQSGPVTAVMDAPEAQPLTHASPHPPLSYGATGVAKSRSPGQSDRPAVPTDATAARHTPSTREAQASQKHAALPVNPSQGALHTAAAHSFAADRQRIGLAQQAGQERLEALRARFHDVRKQLNMSVWGDEDETGPDVLQDTVVTQAPTMTSTMPPVSLPVGGQSGASMPVRSQRASRPDRPELQQQPSRSEDRETSVSAGAPSSVAPSHLPPTGSFYRPGEAQLPHRRSRPAPRHGGREIPQLAEAQSDVGSERGSGLSVEQAAPEPRYYEHRRTSSSSGQRHHRPDSRESRHRHRPRRPDSSGAQQSAHDMERRSAHPDSRRSHRRSHSRSRDGHHRRSRHEHRSREPVAGRGAWVGEMREDDGTRRTRSRHRHRQSDQRDGASEGYSAEHSGSRGVAVGERVGSVGSSDATRQHHSSSHRTHGDRQHRSRSRHRHRRAHRSSREDQEYWQQERVESTGTRSRPRPSHRHRHRHRHHHASRPAVHQSDPRGGDELVRRAHTDHQSHRDVRPSHRSQSSTEVRQHGRAPGQRQYRSDDVRSLR